MATEHSFRTHLVWRKSGDGPTSGNHHLEYESRAAVEVSAAPQYRGDPTKLNPEELFLGALASCQMLTYVTLAARGGIDVLSYEDDAEAKLAMVERRMRIAGVTLRPRIRIAVGADREKAERLVEGAHQGCFIANSVACPVTIEAAIEVGDG